LEFIFDIIVSKQFKNKKNLILNNCFFRPQLLNINGRIIVAVTVQSAFRLEMHKNKVFLFLKKLFLTSPHQNDLKI
jgi:hypothetical protein